MCKVKECKDCGQVFEKTGVADKFCLVCRERKANKQRFCAMCETALPRTQGRKKYCKHCAGKAMRMQSRRKSIEAAVGKARPVRFIRCLECKKTYTANPAYKKKIDVCGPVCLASAYAKTARESAKWLEYPFQFKLSESVVAVRSVFRRVKDKARVGFCGFCGCSKVMGDAQRRAVAKGGRFFCDQECSNNWKSIHYASPNHRPFEESRQRTRVKREAEQAEKKKRNEAREIAKLLRPINQKTAGYVTCAECKKTIWVEQHANKKYCSSKCSRNAYRKTDRYKEYCRDSKRDREHKKRSHGIGDRITIKQLMRRYRSRCVNCKTKCVLPEGYNQPNEANIDHILPVSKGGLHIWSNVQLLCRTCNIAKSDKVLPNTQLMLDLKFK